MKKATLAFSALSVAFVAVGVAAAAFTDGASADNNLFSAGTLQLEISQDQIAWSPTNTLGAWTTPLSWAPGETYTDTVYLRNSGTVDAEVLSLYYSSLNNSDVVNPLSDVTCINRVRYDLNGNGTFSGGENVTAAYLAAYTDTDADGCLSLTELLAQAFDATTGYNFETTTNVLPGSITNPAVSVSGKALELQWLFEATAGNQYQGDTATVDFDFLASNV